MRNARAAALGLVGALAVWAGAGQLLADDKHKGPRQEKGHESDVHQDEVLQALRRNEIRPLQEIAAVAEKAMPGPVVGMKVKRLGGILVYELKIISEGGWIREVYIDAATLSVVKIE